MANQVRATTVDFGLLDGIRAIAAFVVVLNHARGHLFVGGKAYLAGIANPGWADWLTVGLLQVSSLGPQAVIVFFVLSGFSIAHSVEHSRSTGGFYFRRAVRLYPPYLGGLVLAWFTCLLFESWPVPQTPRIVSVFNDLGTGLRNLFYMISADSLIPQYWSLAHEVLFYAIAPIALMSRFLYWFIAVSFAALAAGMAINGVHGAFVGRFVFDYAAYFALGVLMYGRREWLARLTCGRSAFYLLCAIAVGTMLLVLRVTEKLSFLVAAALSVFLIANFLHHRMSGWVLGRVGQMSYTLYVTHFAAIYLWGFLCIQTGLISGMPSSNPLFWLTSIPFCLIVGTLFYLTFERPTIQYLRKLRTAPTKTEVAPLV